MRAIIQRVSQASVTIERKVKSSVEHGLLVLAGFEENDTPDDLLWMSQKISNLRIFGDADGLMNLSVKDIGGQILVISQFTLFASTKKGNRPSFIRAAKPDISVPLYNQFVKQLEKDSGVNVFTGEFGADMKVALLNDGPVTIFIDSKNKE